MRAALPAIAITLLVGNAAADAQITRQQSIVRRPDGKVRMQETRTPVRRGYGNHHGHGRHIGHGRHHHHGHHHHRRGSYYPGYYGFGFGVNSLGIYGSGLNYYRGPATYGGITPPVYVDPLYGGYGYGGFGYGPTYSYGTAVAPAVQAPLYNSLQQYRYDNDWTRLSAELADRAMRNVEDPRPGTGAVPVPSTPEAKIKSARFEAMGDESFANQDYAKALAHYKTATRTAKDNGGAFFKAAYANVALSRYSAAIEYFKRGLAVEPAVAMTGPTPSELYGDHTIAWTTHLGQVTRWVAEDVRDAQRVFLLGTLLLLDGDTRATEFLEKAWQLSGGTEPAIVALLRPPTIENAEPAADPAVAPMAVPADDAVDAANQDAPQQVEGPTLGPVPAEDESITGDLELPRIPQPPQTTRSLTSERPYGQEPLFPLPSEQDDATGQTIPPLPEE